MPTLPNIPNVGGISFAGAFESSVYWLGYGLAALLVLGSFAVLMYLMMFKYKVRVISVSKIGDNEKHVVPRSIKNDRGRMIKDKGVPMFQLLFARTKIKPVENEFIWPRKTVFLSKRNSTYVPIKPVFVSNELLFKEMESDVNFWAQTELEKADRDYTKINSWDKYGNVIVMAGTVLFCLILVGVTVYYTYQHANGVVGALGGVSDAIRSGSLIPGR